MTVLAEQKSAEFLLPEMVGGDMKAWPVSVLVVEDDDDAAELARIQLSGNGEFATERSRNLRQAMRRLAEPGIDAVLLDLGLPELNGYRSYRALMQAVPRAIPVVVYTSDERPLSREITLEFGAADYLVKDQTSAVQLKRSVREAVVTWMLRQQAALKEPAGDRPAE